MRSYLVGLECVSCGKVTSDMTRHPLCSSCGGFLEARYDLEEVKREVDRDAIARMPRGIWRWRALLPVREEANIVTLQEGDTPFFHARRLGAEVGCPNFFIKDESRNPSGSFKDRGASVTVSKCKEVGIKGLIIASSGNASSSFSTYCARAGLEFIGFMRRETIPGHLLQNLIFGTRAFVVEGDMVDGTRLAQQVAEKYGLFHCTQPYNLYRMEGKKTLAYEISEALGWRVPDRILVPTGGGTNILALYKGYRELNALGWVRGMPALDVIQSTGCAPLVRAWERGEPVRHWGKPTTRSTGLGHPFPKAGDLVVRIVKETGGKAWAVTDEDNFEAARRTARLEGLFLQPASASPAACLMELRQAGESFGEQVVIGIATGTGKNQVEAALAELAKPPFIEANLASFEAAHRKGGVA